jgi:hypothetical protein
MASFEEIERVVNSGRGSIAICVRLAVLQRMDLDKLLGAFSPSAAAAMRDDPDIYLVELRGTGPERERLFTKDFRIVSLADERQGRLAKP